MSETLFDKFWRNHPALQVPPIYEPCSTDGKSHFDNQCAIRFGVCLENSGIRASCKSVMNFLKVPC